jgi:hypothetical protein
VAVEKALAAALLWRKTTPWRWAELAPKPSGPGAWVGRLRKKKKEIRNRPAGGLGCNDLGRCRKMKNVLQFLYNSFEFETKV